MVWRTQIDKEVSSNLSATSNIRIVSGTIMSPTIKRAIQEFCVKFPSTKHISYDAVSSAALLLASEQCFGERILPDYRFDLAEIIVSFNADFLGTWISPIEYAHQYAKGRKITDLQGAKMSRHFQFESILSNTGANADYRSTYKPSQEGLVALSLYNAVAKLSGVVALSGTSIKLDHLDKAAKDLVASKGASIIVSGSNDPEVQKIIAATNSLVGAYGTTINTGLAVHYRQGNDMAMSSFIKEAAAGSIAAVIFYNANPVYNHPMGAALAAALPKIGLSLATNDRADETASLCQFIAPDSHYLESWNDAEPKAGFYSLTQPGLRLPLLFSQPNLTSVFWPFLIQDFQQGILAVLSANPCVCNMVPQ